jgi:hypothetical protein
MSFKTIIFLISILCFSTTLKAQTVEDIIAKHVAFIGGEQWKKIRTIKSTGIYNYGGIEFPFVAWSKTPGMYKYVVAANGKYFAQAFDGENGWRIDQFNKETSKTILTGKEAKSMANEADVEFENPFINYKEKGYQAILEGKDSVGNNLCYQVKFIETEIDTATYFFSIDNFILLKKIAASKNPEMTGNLLETYYEDYRKIDGIAWPFRTISKVGGDVILTITVQNIEYNIPISDSEFQP